MYAENEIAPRVNTLADSIHEAHKLADLIESGLDKANGILSGMGQVKGDTNAAPSCGLAADARSLVGRMERILQSLAEVNNQLSAPTNLADFQQGVPGVLRNAVQSARY